MKIIDITGILEKGMWSYGPPFPEIEIKPLTTIDKDGVDTHAITLCTISGTYLETGAHILKKRQTVDQLPLQRLITEAVIIKLAKKKEAGEHIIVKDLEETGVDIREGDALLVYTGWDKMWNRAGFVEDSPHFTRESMEWILSRRISLLGADLPCYDDPREGSLTTELSLLKGMFEKDILVLAPLVNLGTISARRVKLITLPLKVKGVSGSPCRAIVIED